MHEGVNRESKVVVCVGWVGATAHSEASPAEQEAQCPDKKEGTSTIPFCCGQTSPGVMCPVLGPKHKKDVNQMEPEEY